jgi:hypothetical protein
VAAGFVVGAAAGALPAAAIWSAPHFEQKRSLFANWFPQLVQNAMPYLALSSTMIRTHSS